MINHNPNIRPGMNLHTEDLIRELEFRGYWSIPKYNVRQASAEQLMELQAVHQDGAQFRNYCERLIATHLGHFLLAEKIIAFTEGEDDIFRSVRALTGSVHVVTEMPKSIMPSTIKEFMEP